MIGYDLPIVFLWGCVFFIESFDRFRIDQRVRLSDMCMCASRFLTTLDILDLLDMMRF